MDKNLQVVKIIGSGSYLPNSPLSLNKVDDVLGRIGRLPVKLAKWLERSKILLNEILEVKNYHFAIDPESGKFTDDNITMAVKAAQKAIDNAGFDVDQIEFIAYGSAHQDQMPTASVRIQEALNIDSCAEMSIHANCTSAYKALMVASDMIKLGRYKTALVVSSNISSSELRADYYNPEKVTKEQLFLRYFLSDGAGAIILQAAEDKSNGVYLEQTITESIGGKKPAAMFNHRPAYWMSPIEEYEAGYHHLAQMFSDQLQNHFFDAGKSVFYHGLNRFIKTYQIDLADVRYFQVNFPSKHISELVLEECLELGINADALYSKMATLGYVGPPMAIICLDKILREEPLNEGDKILSYVTEVSKFMQAGFLCKKY